MVQPAGQGGAPAGERRQQQQGGFGQSLTGIIRMAVMSYFAMKFFSPKKPSEPSQLMSNLFQKGETLDMWLYLSEKQKFNDYSNENALIWHETSIPYAVWGPTSSRSLSMKYIPSEAVKHNGSLYAHVFFARSGYPPDPSDPEYQPGAAFGRTHSVVTYLPKSKADKRKSLLGNQKGSEDEVAPKVKEEVKENTEDESKDEGPVEWVSYWKPNITVNLVDDFTGTMTVIIFIRGECSSLHLLINILKYMIELFFLTLDVDLNVDPISGNYYPTIFFNEFWLLRDKLIALNDTVTELPLNLEVGPISMTKWQLFLQIEQSFQVHRSYGSMLEGEADELKA